MAYIQGLVIQQESSVFVSSTTGVVGQTINIPTPNSGGQVDSDYWAQPIVGSDIIGTGFKYIPTTAIDANKPTPQSFHVIRVISKTESTDWYVLGTSVQYNAASKEAESGTTSSPAIILPTASSLPVFAPCDVICNMDTTTGFYTTNVGAPNQAGSPPASLLPQGYYNGVALPAANPSGYATPAALLTFLNTPTTGWAAVGTWTKSADNLTFFVAQAAGATGTNVLCAKITTV